jgi:hypothetical protein
VGYKLSTILLVCVCILLGNQSLWGQNAADTDVFQTVSQSPQPDGASAPTTTFTGEFVVNFTVTIPLGDQFGGKLLGCIVEARVDDAGSGSHILEKRTELGFNHGATGGCTVQFSYSWNLASASTDKVKLSYTLFSPNTGAALGSGRVSHVENFLSISVPASGTTTTRTVAATY